MAFLRDKRLGIAENGGRYDLPFHKDQGTDFLMIMVGLMTFLSVMALMAAFVLSGISERWSSGLKNNITIEISSDAGGGVIRSDETINSLKKKVGESLSKNASVESYEILEKQDVEKMLEPWLGDNALTETIPLPGLVSVKMKSSEPAVLQPLERDMKALDTGIAVDTHDSWLKALLRLTGTLRLTTLFTSGIIAVTTVIAIAGAVRARMAIHRADVELLHLMGADDGYIMRQFQRHTVILSLKGAVAGLALGIILLLAVMSLTTGSGDAGLPALQIDPSQVLFLLLTPAIMCAIAGLTARFTVLSALARMP